MIEGFEKQEEGQIEIEGKEVVKMRKKKRNIGMVFKDYEIFKNMKVEKKVQLGMRVQGK